MFEIAFICLTLFSASYIQATTGFAFGLLVLSAVSVVDFIPVIEVALIINVLSIINHLFSFKGWHRDKIDKRALVCFLLTCLPATMLGVLLLSYLDNNNLAVLKILLGLCIVFSSLSMLIKLRVLKEPSSAGGFLASGLLSGLMGGMFATFGPPLSYMMYRQPLALDIIRNTLLTAFFVVSSTRLLVSIPEGVSSNIGWYIVLSGPFVICGALLARYKPIAISNTSLRLIAFTLLLIAGSVLLYQGAMSLK